VPGNAKEAAVSKTPGIILCVLGALGLGWGGLIYSTQDRVFDMGSIHVTREKTHSVPLPPIVGGLALISGIVLLLSGSRKGMS